MAQPTYLPLWATDDTTLPATGETNKVRPREVLRTTGWDMGQIPTCEEWNWMFNNIYLWIEYLSGIYADATNLATPNTLALRDDEGSLAFHDLAVENDLTVANDLSTSGSLTVGSAAQITGDLTVDGDANVVEGNLIVKKSSSSSYAIVHIDSSGDTNSGSSVDYAFNNVVMGDVRVNKNTDNSTFMGIAVNPAGDWTDRRVTLLEVDGSSTKVGVNGNFTTSGTASFSQVEVTGGNIDGTTIGGSTPSPGTFSTLQANNSITLDGDVTSSGTNTYSGINTFSEQLNLQSSNISANGYSYLPNGLMIQWGTVTVGTSSDTNVGASVTFPTTFPNAVFSTTANTTTRFFTTSDGYTAICACVGQSTTGFTVYVDSGNAEKLTQAQTVNWFAIGH